MNPNSNNNRNDDPRAKKNGEGSTKLDAKKGLGRPSGTQTASSARAANDSLAAKSKVVARRGLKRTEEERAAKAIARSRKKKEDERTPAPAVLRGLKKNRGTYGTTKGPKPPRKGRPALVTLRGLQKNRDTYGNEIRRTTREVSDPEVIVTPLVEEVPMPPMLETDIPQSSPSSSDLAPPAPDRRVVPNESLVEARPVLEGSSRQVLPEAQQVHPGQLRPRQKAQMTRRDRLILFCLAAVSFLILIVALPVGLRSKKGEEETKARISSRSDMTREEYMLSLLPDYTKAAIDPNYTGTWSSDVSPQTKAFHWTMQDPNFRTYDDWKLRQRFALVCLFHSTGGDTSWGDDNNWLSYGEIDEYQWFSKNTIESPIVQDNPDWSPYFGLKFDALYYMDLLLLEDSPEMSHLWLADNNLTGTIPPEFYLLSQLRTFDLTGNSHLSGTVSSLIGNMPRLQAFSVAYSGMSGRIPSEMGLLTKLLALAFFKNKLEGTIPTEIGMLRDMIILQFEDSGLSGPIPSQMGLLSTMPLIARMGGNDLTGTLPTELGEMFCPYSDFSRNLLTGTLPSELANMLPNLLDVQEAYLDKAEEVFPAVDIRDLIERVFGSVSGLVGIGLTGLSLYTNSLTGQIPKEFGSLEDARILELQTNILSGTIHSELGALTSLLNLLLDHNDLTGTIPSELGMLPSCEWLHLSGNSLSGPIPSELGKLSRLDELYLSGNSFTGPLPSELGKLSHLDELYLSGNSFTGPIPSEIGMLSQPRTSLDELYLNDNSFSGQIPSELGMIRGLDKLDLSNLQLVNGSIPQEIWGLEYLYYLNVTGSPGLAGTFPSEICYLQNASCFYKRYSFSDPKNCSLNFDCSNLLCGCDCEC